VKVHDVLADKVVDLGITVLAPVIVKVQAAIAITEILKARDVTDRRVQPDIEVLVLGSRDLKTEIRRITRDVPIPQAGLKPFFEFRNHVLVERGIGHPCSESLFVLTEFEEVVLGLALDRCRAGQD